MKATKGNMKDQILTNDDKILHCLACDAEYSGNAGDYWDLPDDYEFTCQCGGEMELVTKKVYVQYA